MKEKTFNIGDKVYYNNIRKLSGPYTIVEGSKWPDYSMEVGIDFVKSLSTSFIKSTDVDRLERIKRKYAVYDRLYN